MVPPSRSVASLSLACALLGVALSRPADSDCTPGGLHINEVRPIAQKSPAEAYLPCAVELFNKGPASASLSGLTLRNLAGATLATLPPWSLPAGAFLTVTFSAGVSDSDFTDGGGEYYVEPPDGAHVFVEDGDGLGLYASGGAIVDFLCWTRTGTTPSGPTLTDARNAGRWTSAGAAAIDPAEDFVMLRLVPDGYDHDGPADWSHLGWGGSDHGEMATGPNAPMLAPINGSAVPIAPVHLEWSFAPFVSAYRLIVATDSLLTTVVVDTLVTTTSLDLALVAPVHFWRVEPRDACGPIPSAAEVWAFYDESLLPEPPAPGGVWRASGGPGLFGRIAVPHELQHKDTRLLCLTNNTPRPSTQRGEKDIPWHSRPGCAEGAAQPGVAAPWDGPHPANHAAQIVVEVRQEEVLVDGNTVQVQVRRRKEVSCRHCEMYCARAVTQMVNEYYGGNLTQDHLSYEQLRRQPAEPLLSTAGVRFMGNVQAPEGDLGHGRGLHGEGTRSSLEWAVMNAQVVHHFPTSVPAQPAGVRTYQPNPPTMAQIAAKIDAGFPVPASKRGHIYVIDGYVRRGFLGVFPPLDLVHVLDPWPTNRSGWRTYSAAQPVNFKPPDDPKPKCKPGDLCMVEWYEINRPGQALGGRMEMATVAADVDLDGIRDFDEGWSQANPALRYPVDRPRMLQSDFSLADTDHDQVRDFREIRAYTFHQFDVMGHAHDPGPFPVAVGFRAERNPNTDFDPGFDGQEDANGDGRFEPAFPRLEGDMFDPQHVGLRVILRKILDQGPGFSIATPDSVFSPLDALELAGGPLHASSSYDFRIYASCPLPLDLGDGYAGGPSPFRTGIVTTDSTGAIVPDSLGTFPIGCYTLVIDALADSAYGAVIDTPAIVVPTDPFVEFQIEEPVDVPPRGAPVAFGLGIRPNPFRGGVRLQIALPRAGTARLTVFDGAGRAVHRFRTGVLDAGVSEVAWNGRDAQGEPLPAGIYVVRLETLGRAATRKVVLLP